jgi:hypothetical protein
MPLNDFTSKEGKKKKASDEQIEISNYEPEPEIIAKGG